jgi:pyridinium-3,5-bisthiocarboxylic acid mononucleotide nickel chelatase
VIQSADGFGGGFAPQQLMRIAYLDCFSGISGDMFLGALIDAGVEARLLEETVAALNLGARLKISKVTRSGITATKVDVFACDGQGQEEKNSPHEAIEHLHGKDFHDGHSHSHEHGHSRGEEHGHAHQRARGLKEIREIIGAAAISESAKTTAITIFEALGTAEAKIHNMEIEKVHFHEVGAVDALVDIVCAAVGAEALGVDEIVCSPLNVGGGTVKCAHGTLPVPAPATVELLKGASVYSSGVQAELVTPTGAAIVKTLVKRFATFPEMRIEKSAYGAGTRDFPGHANVLRLTIGEAPTQIAGKTLRETISVLEANLDDMNPQVFGYVVDRLLDEGALDVFGLPVQMKKNRPGMLLTVLCNREDVSKLTDLIFKETTTLGVREREEKRRVLARKWITVGTRWGNIRLKIASMNGTVTNYAPEYEDCRKIAAAHHVPLKSVMQEAMQGYLNAEEQRR